MFVLVCAKQEEKGCTKADGVGQISIKTFTETVMFTHSYHHQSKHV